MNILVFSDIHGDMEFLSIVENDIRQADIIMLSGDITHFGRERQVKKICDTFTVLNKNLVAIPGNCDYPEVNQYLVKQNMSLDCRFFVQDNIFFMGVGGSLPCPGKTPNEYSEEDFAVMLDETVSANSKGLPIILLMHQPPFNTLTDQLSDGFHLGSHSIRQFVEKYQPLVCFCGHIHESIGIDTIGKTTIVNPGPFNLGRYTNINVQNNAVSAEIVNIFMT